MTKIDTAAMFARIAANLPHDPYGPVDHPLQHRVTLPTPSTYVEELNLWDDARAWCREQMEKRGGEKWSRHRDRPSGTFLFTFTPLSTAIHFKLKFL